MSQKGIDSTSLTMMAGVKKTNLKFKTPKTTLAPTEFRGDMIQKAQSVSSHLAGTAELEMKAVLKALSDKGLTDFRKHMTSGKAPLEKRLQTVSEYTEDAKTIDDAIAMLETARARLNILASSAFARTCSTVGDLIAAIDKEIGRREASKNDRIWHAPHSRAQLLIMRSLFSHHEEPVFSS